MGVGIKKSTNTQQSAQKADPVKGGSWTLIAKTLQAASQVNTYNATHPEKPVDTSIAYLKNNVRTNQQLLSIDQDVAEVAKNLDEVAVHFPVQQLVDNTQTLIGKLEDSSAATRADRDLDRAMASQLSDDLQALSARLTKANEDKAALDALHADCLKRYQEALRLQAEIGVPALKDRQPFMAATLGDLKILYPGLMQAAKNYDLQFSQYQKEMSALYTACERLLNRVPPDRRASLSIPQATPGLGQSS